MPPSQRLALSVGAVLLALVSWELAADQRWVNPLVTSSPLRIVGAAYDLSRSGTLGHAVGESASLFAVGFGCALVAGLIVGIAIGWYGRLSAVLDPFVSMLYSAPLLATIPLIMVWAGIGFTTQVIVVWLVAVFPILINVATGVSSADRDLIQLARSFRGTTWQVLITVVLPGAVPNIVAGVRQGMIQGLVGVVVAEYFVGDNGLGGMIFYAGETLNMSAAFVGVVIFAASAIILTMAIRKLQRQVDYWRVS